MKTAINNSLKKGFTIVELAIVLVVIGIILGMAVKGKALLHSARIKAEVAKLNKFEAAVATYFAKTGTIENFWIPAGSWSEREAERKNFSRIVQ
jgi:prepilin-type N-terminal cleavage/methylation domain-containing protein